MEKIEQYLSEGKTYSEIARTVGRTPERIRQICKKNRWERKPFNYELPKIPSRLSVLKASGKPWCHECKAQDVPLMISTRLYGKAYYRCQPCNQKRCNKYYHTTAGKQAVLRANRNWAAKLDK